MSSWAWSIYGHTQRVETGHRRLYAGKHDIFRFKVVKLTISPMLLCSRHLTTSVRLRLASSINDDSMLAARNDRPAHAHRNSAAPHPPSHPYLNTRSAVKFSNTHEGVSEKGNPNQACITYVHTSKWSWRKQCVIGRKGIEYFWETRGSVVVLCCERAKISEVSLLCLSVKSWCDFRDLLVVDRACTCVWVLLIFLAIPVIPFARLSTE